MYLTNKERLLKVVLKLFSKPSQAPSYFCHLITGKSPLELRLPWWSYDAINYLKNLKFESCFEWGSGGSTLFLATLCKQVTAVENDSKWYKKLESEIRENQLKNISLLHRDLNLSNSANFKKSVYFNSLNKKYDLIIIDGEDHFGPESSWSARTACFEKAQDFINPDGLIVVDDSWRYPEIKKLSNASSSFSFESLGPARRGVTSTDIYLY